MTDTITTRNASGQVATILLDGPQGQSRREIIEQRIARGELTKVAKSAKAEDPSFGPVVEDYHTGLRDEKGDLLRSVHGGGVDPDAEGDAAGQPSGSKVVDGMVKVDVVMPIGDSHPAAAVEAPNDAADLPDDPSTGGAPTAAAARQGKSGK